MLMVRMGEISQSYYFLFNKNGYFPRFDKIFCARDISDLVLFGINSNVLRRLMTRSKGRYNWENIYRFPKLHFSLHENCSEKIKMLKRQKSERDKLSFLSEFVKHPFVTYVLFKMQLNNRK